MNLKRFALWWTDAATELGNGFLRGLLPGTGVGGVAAAQEDTMDVSTLTFSALGALAVTAFFNGLVHVVVWHRSNPIPNPFRGGPEQVGEYTVVESK